MEIYLTEKEQIEQIKKWWRQYGKLTLLSLVVVLALVFGWRAWTKHETQIAVNASVAYEQLFTVMTNNDTAAVTTLAQNLMTNFQTSPYAADAALILAKVEVQQNNLAGASTNLRWVLENAKNNAVRQVARLRLARIMIAEKQAPDALTLLDTIDDPTYVGAIDYVKGDAFLAQGNKAKAREQYRLALQVLPDNTVITPLVAMKYEALATPEDLAKK